MISCTVQARCTAERDGCTSSCQAPRQVNATSARRGQAGLKGHGSASDTTEIRRNSTRRAQTQRRKSWVLVPGFAARFPAGAPPHAGFQHVPTILGLPVGPAGGLISAVAPRVSRVSAPGSAPARRQPTASAPARAPTGLFPHLRPRPSGGGQKLPPSRGALSTSLQSPCQHQPRLLQGHPPRPHPPSSARARGRLFLRGAASCACSVRSARGGAAGRGRAR